MINSAWWQGMMDKSNLLDLIRTFTLFSTNDKGQTIKIVGRYQQFRAVKHAVQRLLQGKNPRERSGIIWHTQGSGKSLTMMFMVREMYRHTALSNWKIVFVTDRTQLEGQLNENQSQYWLYSKGSGQYQETQGAAQRRHLGSGDGHDP
nr:DEAD/DEAH box helicase family protein [uncultured Sphaerochaeta sp.]